MASSPDDWDSHPGASCDDTEGYSSGFNQGGFDTSFERTFGSRPARDTGRKATYTYTTPKSPRGHRTVPNSPRGHRAVRYDVSSGTKARLERLEQERDSLKKEVKTLKKAADQSSDLVAKMAETLDNINEVASAVKTLLQSQSQGTVGAVDADADELPPPDDPEERRQLFWDEVDGHSGGDGVSGARSKGDGSAMVSPWLVNPDTLEVITLEELEDTRIEMRGALTDFEYSYPNRLKKTWLSNSESTRSLIRGVIYRKKPYLRAAKGHWKFNRMMSKVLSDHYPRMIKGIIQDRHFREQVEAELKGQPLSLKRELIDEDGATLPATKKIKVEGRKGKTTKKHSLGISATLPSSSQSSPLTLVQSLPSTPLLNGPSTLPEDSSTPLGTGQPAASPTVAATPQWTPEQLNSFITQRQQAQVSTPGLDNRGGPLASTLSSSVRSQLNFNGLDPALARSQPVATPPALPLELVAPTSTATQPNSVAPATASITPTSVPSTPNDTNLAIDPALAAASSLQTLLVSQSVRTGGDDDELAAASKSAAASVFLPSVANGWTAPPPLPPPPPPPAQKENVPPQPGAATAAKRQRRAPGEGVFTIHNFKTKKDARSVYAHVWYANMDNRGRKTKDFNADFAKLKPEEVAVYEAQVETAGA